MFALYVTGYMIPKLVILKVASHPELLLRIFPMIGYAPSVELAKTCLKS